MAIMGVGMVFFWTRIDERRLCDHQRNTTVREFIQVLHGRYLPWRILKCALAGCLLTTLVQSSSATLGITISLATQGVIGYETAAALVLGENIGTTITALLASLGATTNAKRAAYFHMIFNLIGVLWITSIFCVVHRVHSSNCWTMMCLKMVLVDGKETYPQHNSRNRPDSLDFQYRQYPSVPALPASFRSTIGTTGTCQGLQGESRV